jgi:hypothetical protein
MADVQELTLSDGIHMLIYPSKWYGWNWHTAEGRHKSAGGYSAAIGILYDRPASEVIRRSEELFFEELNWYWYIYCQHEFRFTFFKGTYALSILSLFLNGCGCAIYRPRKWVWAYTWICATWSMK